MQFFYLQLTLLVTFPLEMECCVVLDTSQAYLCSLMTFLCVVAREAKRLRRGDQKKRDKDGSHQEIRVFWPCR